MISDIAKIICGYLHEYIIFDIGKIHWRYLSSNSHPDAIKLLLENPEKIDWWYLSINKNLFLKIISFVMQYTIYYNVYKLSNIIN
jgi:hypothetical protein